MATLTVRKGTLTGATATFEAAAGGGDEFANTGREMLLISKQDAVGDPVTITADAPKADNFGIVNAAHDATVSISNGEQKLMGPFPVDRFNDDNNKVQLTYSGVSNLKLAVLAP